MRIPHLFPLLLLVGLGVPAAADATVLPAASVDGPSADIQGFGNVDIASDGTGGVVWIKKDGVKNHVFVARIANGATGAPERADVGVDAIEARPRIAATPGGKLLVTYLRDDGAGNKIGYSKTDGPGQQWDSGNVVGTAGPYISNDLEQNANGIAYNINSKANGDVIAFRWNGTTWTELAAPLDSNAGNTAGGSMGQDEPHIAVTDDGNAVAIWSEGPAVAMEKVYARRLTGTTAGAAVEASVPTLNGALSANSAFMVDVDVDATGAAWLLFRNDFTYPGPTNKPRLLVRKLTGDTTLTAPQVVDGLPTPPPEGGEFPRIDVNSSGQGLIATSRQLSFESYFSTLSGDTWTAGTRIDATASTQPTRGVGSIGDNGAGLIAWRDKTGPAADARVLARRLDGGVLAPEIVVSNPAFGDVDGGFVTETAADANGNVAVAFVQGPAAQRRIVVAIVDKPAAPADPGTGGGGGGTPGGGDPGTGGTGGNGGTGNNGGGGPVADVAAPLLGKLKLAAVSFTTSTTVSFTLNEAATVKFTVEQKTKTKTKKVKYVRKGSFNHKGTVGANKVKLKNKIGKKKLAPGTYRLTIETTDAAGNKAKAQRKTFKILKAVKRRK